MTTLHFRAENFEATATMVSQTDCYGSAARNWVVTAGGIGAYSVREIPRVDDAVMTQVLTSVGWKDVVFVPAGLNPLYLTIQLLYSVTGVEVYEP